MTLPDPPTTGQIRSARKAAGLTQRAAASLAHASLRGWEDWEAGRHRMPPVYWSLFQLRVSNSADLELLRRAIRQTLDENAHLADGDCCTLIALKLALRATGIPWAGD